MPARTRNLARALALCLPLALAAGCERAAQHPTLAASDLPDLIRAHEFVFNRDAYGGFSFSPDGSRLAWHGPDGWRKRLHVRNAAGVVHKYRVGGSSMHWSADSRRLLILDDKSGAENHRLYRLDVDDPSAELEDLTPYPGVRVWLFATSPSDPEHVLVLHNRRDRNLRDLYRINLTTGAEELVAQNPGDGVAPVLDADGKLVGWRKSAVAMRPRGKPRPAELRERSALSRKSEDVTRTVGLSPDRKEAWVLSNHGRDHVALFGVDTATGAARIVHQDPRADVSRVITSKRTGRPLAVTVHGDYPRTRILDAALEADLAPLLAQYAATRFGFDIVSTDASEQQLVVSIYTHGNRRYYLVDRGRKSFHLLGSTRDAAFERALAAPQAIEFTARDGMTIPAYLLRPAGTAGKALPLVVLVHGGPWQRIVWSDVDSSEDMLRAQFLANRGYAVLAINFRGSTGLGRTHVTAAVGEMGAAMQDDLVDGVQWAVREGIADPSRVAIMGHSYGGYATLMALAQQPRLFACGIDIAGPTDLVDLIERFPSYWELELDYWYRYVGDPAVPVDRSRMEAASPVRLADRIERPVLIIQGANDVRVRPEQSARMVEALQRAGKPVRYVLIPEMGHSLGYWAHHLRVLRDTEHFLADCLGGRAARFDPLEWAARLSGRLPLLQ